MNSASAEIATGPIHAQKACCYQGW